MPTVFYSMVEGGEVVNSVDGQLAVVRCIVKGVTITAPAPGEAGGDSTVLSRVSPYLPSIFHPHPDTVNYPNLTLREYRIRSIRSFSEVIVDLIYRAPGISSWVLEEISQSEYLQTWTTAGGTNPLLVWFKKGASNTVIVPPTGAGAPTPQAISVQRYFGKRILKAGGWMKYTDWQAIRKNVRNALWTINHTQWGDDTVNDAVGCWLFANMTTTTRDLNHTKEISLYFINDPRGWYPIGVYIDQTGKHPAGGTTEQGLRALGPPVIGGSLQMNGISMYSVYQETEFNTLFNFDPSQA